MDDSSSECVGNSHLRNSVKIIKGKISKLESSSLASRQVSFSIGSSEFSGESEKNDCPILKQKSPTALKLPSVLSTMQTLPKQRQSSKTDKRTHSTKVYPYPRPEQPVPEKSLLRGSNFTSFNEKLDRQTGLKKYYRSNRNRRLVPLGQEITSRISTSRNQLRRKLDTSSFRVNNPALKSSNVKHTSSKDQTTYRDIAINSVARYDHGENNSTDSAQSERLTNQRSLELSRSNTGVSFPETIVSISSNKTIVGGTHISLTKEQTKNISDLTESILIQQKAKNTFARTKCFDEAMRKIKGSNKVILLSNFGEGRTSLGNEILMELNMSNAEEYKQKQPIIIRNASEWRLTVNPCYDTAVFLDDVFGKTVLSKDLVREWEAILPDMHACINDVSSSVFLIIAINKYIFHAIKDKLCVFDLFSNMQSFIVDLSKYDREDRELILTKHCKNPKSSFFKYEIVPDVSRDTETGSFIPIKRKDIQEILEISNPVAFPSCCSLYINNEKGHMQGSELFKNPVEILCPYIEDICDSDKITFLLLTLILFSETESLPVDFYNKKSYVSLIKEIANMHSMPNAEWLPGKLEEKLSKIQSVFIDDVGGMLHFKSNAVRDSVGKVFGKQQIKHLIENIRFELLVTLTSFNETSNKKIYVKDCYLNPLVDRFVHEIGKLSCVSGIKRNIELIAGSEVIMEESFRKKFVYHLTRLGNYKTIIQCKDSNESMNLISTLFQHEQYRAYSELVTELLRQKPIIDTICCRQSRQEPLWFVKELHRSFEYAIDNNHQYACSILHTMYKSLMPERLLLAYGRINIDT